MYRARTLYTSVAVMAAASLALTGCGAAQEQGETEITFLTYAGDDYVGFAEKAGFVNAEDKADEKARAILQQLYPDREVVSLNVDPLGEAGGGIHCATQQQPKGAA